MNKTVKNSAVYLLGTIVMGVLGFVNTMLLTRILSQQVYAMYGLLTTFTTAVITFVSFGYDSSYMRFYYNHGLSQKKYIFKCLKVPIIVFVIFGLIVLEPSHTLITYIFETEFSIYILLILLAYIFFSFLHKFTQLTARMEEYAGNYIFSNIVGKSGFIIVLIIIYYILKNVTFDWVLVSFTIGGFASVLINLIVFKSLNEGIITNKANITQKDLFAYGFPYMINNVLILVIPVIEKLIIRDLAGWEVLSIYTAASIFQTVVLLLTNTITNIWNPIVFKNCDNEKIFKPILHNFGMATTVIVTLGLAACILLRRWLVLLLDSSYYTVYIIAPSILYGACFNIVSIIYSIGINIKKKTIHLIIAPIIQAIISLGLFFILVPSLGLIGVAIATLASLIISKTYRITVGLLLYGTGDLEWKSLLICIIGVAFSVLSLFLTSLINDILMSSILIILMLAILNKDIASLCKTVLSLVKPAKK